VPDEKSLKWECVVGDEKGATGTEQPTRIKVAEDIYFVSWVEKTGITVTQVVNFKDKKVISTVVVGGQRYVLEGSVEKE
jgi:phenolic acid decarboxylase